MPCLSRRERSVNYAGDEGEEPLDAPIEGMKVEGTLSRYRSSEDTYARSKA